MDISIDSAGLTINEVNAFKPPLVKIKKICDAVSKELGVVFQNTFEGNDDDRTMFFPFVEELAEEFADEAFDAAEKINEKLRNK